MRLFSLISFACLVLLFSACRKDQEFTEINKKRPTPTVIIETVIQGVVTDRTGNPLENALVEFDQERFQTDANGYFILKGNAPSRKALIRIEKDGFFHTVHSVTPQEKDTVSASIQLVERANSGSFSTSEGGSIQFGNGSSVDFQADGFVDAQGNPYNGNVLVYAHLIDPTDPDIARFMPGDLTARNAEGEDRLLESYGMINVELEDESGQSLQISKAATLNIAVPSSLRNSAPNEIPLWHFDETEGLWVEEGSARLENGIYTGEVSHFSFWNCDIPYELVNINGIVRMGEYTPKVEVCLTRSTNGNQRCSVTSLQGAYGGAVPRDETLLLEIVDHCGNILHSQNIGPYSVDSQVDPINVTNNGTFTLVFGSVEDCNQNTVTDGYTIVEFEGSDERFFLPVNTFGRFFGMLPNCSATQLEAFATDRSSQEYGNPATYSVTQSTNLGTLAACGNQFAEGVHIEYNGTTYNIDNCTVQHEAGSGLYVFVFEDPQANGNKVLYRYTFIDWNMDPENPVWAGAVEHTLLGTPDPIFTFSGDIQSLEVGSQSGEFVIIEISNADVEEQPSGNTFPNGYVRFSGRIE